MNLAAAAKLRLSLAEAIQKWMDDNCESNEWSCLGWVETNAASQMANAAFIVLDYSRDLQDYLRAEGELKE